MKNFNNARGFFNLIRPICGICQKEVEDIQLWNDFKNDKIIITVYCHNDQDSMSIDIPEVPYIDFNCFEQGYAFNRKMINSTKLLENHNVN